MNCYSTQVTFYRCLDCICSGIICGSCCLADHRRHPFHSIQKWNGQHFESSSLHDLGFVLCIGHGGGRCPASDDEVMDDFPKSCANVSKAPNFTVVDIGGIYSHIVQWCQCHNAPPKRIQLLRMGLYPASITSPQTAFTIRLLQYYHMDALECNTPALNFYRKLRRLSNKYHPDKVPVSAIILFMIQLTLASIG